jgi:hypothetical protein
MLRPCIKVVWDGRTTWSATEFSLSIATLVIILKITLRRHICRHCWILSAPKTLGNKVSSPKFRRNSSSSPVWGKSKKTSKLFYCSETWGISSVLDSSKEKFPSSYAPTNFNCSRPSITSSSWTRDRISSFLCLPLALLWKYLVFESPSRIN